MIYGKRRAIPFERCMSERAARAGISAAGFDVSVDRTRVRSTCPEGTVARTEPRGFTSQGSNVTLVISKGPARSSDPPDGPDDGPDRPGGGPGQGPAGPGDRRRPPASIPG
jgi:hypothetical protein